MISETNLGRFSAFRLLVLNAAEHIICYEILFSVNCLSFYWKYAYTYTQIQFWKWTHTKNGQLHQLNH